MNEQHIEIKKQARYWQSAAISDTTKEVWVVLHGYGQLAQFFIRKFQPIMNDERVIIAAEGMHRFYREGYSGRVGASWMTREDRETDIEDYIGFIDDLITLVRKQQPNLKLTVLGFSQGAATASRWANYGNESFDRLIMWASVFPPDMDFNLERLSGDDIRIDMVYPLQDEFTNRQDFCSHLEKLDNIGLPYNVKEFDGKHDIEANTLKELSAFT